MKHGINVYELNIFHQCSSEFLYLEQNYLVLIEILFRNRYGSIDSVGITRYASEMMTFIYMKCLSF